MKLKILTVILGTLVLASCAVESVELDTEETPIECDESEQLLGGWNDAEVTPEAEKALDFVLMQMNTAAKLEKILGVKTQVVAGRNYAIDFQLDNGEVWNTIVYQDLSGNYTMTKPATQGTITDNCP